MTDVHTTGRVDEFPRTHEAFLAQKAIGRARQVAMAESHPGFLNWAMHQLDRGVRVRRRRWSEHWLYVERAPGVSYPAQYFVIYVVEGVFLSWNWSPTDDGGILWHQNADWEVVDDARLAGLISALPTSEPTGDAQ